MQSNTLSPVASTAQEATFNASPQERTVHWKKHVQQWQLSGLSQAAYSKQHNLIYHQMTYWCRKFTTDPDPQSDTTNKDHFMAVAVEQPATDHVPRLLLPNGLELRGLSRESMSTVIRIIECL